MDARVGVKGQITEQEFRGFQQLLYETAGITLSPAKTALVEGRLGKRLSALGLASYGQYLNLITHGKDSTERQTALDLLTTNETYFFREPRHFNFLRDEILPCRRSGNTFRVWSAACSSGEEVYSIAMTLRESIGDAPWEVIGTDISSRVLEKARSAHYPLTRNEAIPKEYLRRFCLKGIGQHQGTFLIDKPLRSRVRFLQANLNAALPELDTFDVIFLRNVMIYFNLDTKRDVVQRVMATLKPGGYLMIGHSESLHGVEGSLSMVRPSIYRKVDA